MYYVLIVDLNNQEHRLKTKDWEEVLKFVKRHRGATKEFKFKRK